MTKQKKPRYTTPAGIAVYPYLSKPDTKFNPDGDYKVNLDVPNEEAGKLIAFLDEQHQASVDKAKEENKGKRVKEGEIPYLVSEDRGVTTFKFKLKAKGKTKAGEEFTQKPALFDSKGTPLTDVSVGGGSKLKVSFELVPYYTAIAGAGISLRLKAVQVLELKEYTGGGNAGAYGFGEEEGYEASEEANNNGFNNEESEEDF